MMNSVHPAGKDSGNETWFLASESKEIVPGLPQSSSLSQVLLNIYSGKIGHLQKHLVQDALRYMHTYDILGTCQHQITSQLQENVNQIVGWSDNNKAIINSAKAKILWCFFNNKICGCQLSPTQSNIVSIERDHYLRYCNITFDKPLSIKM